MNWFYNLKIARKLMLSFAAVIVLTVILGVFAIRQIREVNQASTNIATNWLPSIKGAQAIQASLPRMRISELQMLTAVQPADREDALKAIKSRLDILARQRAEYEKQISEPEEKTLYAEFSKSFNAYLEIDKKLAELSGAGQHEEARALFKGDSNKNFRGMVETLDGIVKVNDAGSTRSDQAAEDMYQSAMRWIIILLAAVVVIAFGLAIDPGDLGSVAVPAAAAIAVSLVLAVVAGAATARINELDRQAAANIAFAVLARGEFALILVTLAAGAGLDDRLAPFVAVYVLVLAVVSPVLTHRSDVIARWLPERVVPSTVGRRRSVPSLDI